MNLATLICWEYYKILDIGMSLSLSGKGGEVCEELRKRMIDVCCLQEVRWRGQGARMLGMKGGRYKLWWSLK